MSSFECFLLFFKYMVAFKECCNFWIYFNYHYNLKPIFINFANIPKYLYWSNFNQCFLFFQNLNPLLWSWCLSSFHNSNFCSFHFWLLLMSLIIYSELNAMASCKVNLFVYSIYYNYEIFNLSNHFEYYCCSTIQKVFDSKLKFDLLFISELFVNLLI